LCDFSALAHSDCPRIPEIEDDTDNLNLGGNSLGQSDQEVSDAEFASILKHITPLTNLTTSQYRSMTKRHIEFIQLLETERNYVNVLMNIVKVCLLH